MLFLTSETDLKWNNIQAIYFYATWMPFHNKLLYVLSKIEEKHKNITSFAIDVDQFANQCIRFSVDTIPSVLFFQDGKEIKRIVGTAKTQIFTDAFDDICTSESHKRRKI